MDMFDILNNVSQGKYFYYIFYSNGFFWRTMSGNGSSDVKAVNATDLIPFVIDLPKATTRARFIITSYDNFVDVDKIEVTRKPFEDFYQFIDRVNGVHQ